MGTFIGLGYNKLCIHAKSLLQKSHQKTDAQGKQALREGKISKGSFIIQGCSRLLLYEAQRGTELLRAFAVTLAGDVTLVLSEE